MSASRRLKAVHVSDSLLVDMMTVGHVSHNDRFVEVIDGLPPGSTLVGASFDPWRHFVRLVFANPAFDEVAEGSDVPNFDCVMRCNMLPRDIPT